MRLAIVVGAILLVLTATFFAILAIFALVDTAWLGAATLAGFAVALYILAYWLYLAWQHVTRIEHDRQRRASAK